MEFKTEMTMKEYCDKQKARWMLDNMRNVPIRPVTDPSYDPYQKCEEYCKSILKTKTGIINQKYHTKTGYGRLMLADGKSGHQNLMREFRSLLCAGDYYDVDITNCHPVILSQVCKSKSLKSDRLQEYVKGRDEIFEKIMKKGITKESIKTEFIKVVFGGSFDFEETLKSIDAKTKVWMKDFQKEMKDIQSHIYKTEKEAVKHVEKDFNKEGSATSIYLQHIESTIIQCAYTFLHERRYHVGSLIFDGLQVRKTKVLDRDVLLKLQKYVKNETGYDVEFTIKDFPAKIPEDQLNYKNLDVYVVDNDAEAAEIILKSIDNKIVKCDNFWFRKKFDHANIYEEISEKQLILTLLDVISEFNIKLNNPKGHKDYSKKTKGANDIARMVMAKMPNDADFREKLWGSCFGKLCFLNGVYDFKSNTFNDYQEEEVTVTYIDRNYKHAVKKDVKLLFDKVIYPILTQDSQREFYLRWLSRGLSGQYTEKTWCVGLGNRNSGKSVITDLCLNSLNNYVGVFNAEEMATQRSGNGDIAKKMMWVVPHEYTRLIFSNELKTEDDGGRKIKLDGNVIKSVASGGDIQKARQLFERERKMKLQGRMTLFMNELPQISPTDAKENLSIVEFSSVFKDEITEKDEKINRLEHSCKFFKKDNSIKQFIQQENMRDAWVHLLISFYNERQEHWKLNEEYESNENNEDNLITELFEFTLDPNDKMTNAEIKDSLTTDMNISKLGLTLKKYGAQAYRTKTSRGYQGLKLRPQKE